MCLCSYSNFGKDVYSVTAWSDHVVGGGKGVIVFWDRRMVDNEPVRFEDSHEEVVS